MYTADELDSFRELTDVQVFRPRGIVDCVGSYADDTASNSDNSSDSESKTNSSAQGLSPSVSESPTNVQQIRNIVAGRDGKQTGKTEIDRVRALDQSPRDSTIGIPAPISQDSTHERVNAPREDTVSPQQYTTNRRVECSTLVRDRSPDMISVDCRERLKDIQSFEKSDTQKAHAHAEVVRASVAAQCLPPRGLRGLRISRRPMRPRGAGTLTRPVCYRPVSRHMREANRYAVNRWAPPYVKPRTAAVLQHRGAAAPGLTNRCEVKKIVQHPPRCHEKESKTSTHGTARGDPHRGSTLSTYPNGAGVPCRGQYCERSRDPYRYTLDLRGGPSNIISKAACHSHKALHMPISRQPGHVTRPAILTSVPFPLSTEMVDYNRAYSEFGKLGEKRLNRNREKGFESNSDSIPSCQSRLLGCPKVLPPKDTDLAVSFRTSGLGDTGYPTKARTHFKDTRQAASPAPVEEHAESLINFLKKACDEISSDEDPVKDPAVIQRTSRIHSYDNPDNKSDYDDPMTRNSYRPVGSGTMSNEARRDRVVSGFDDWQDRFGYLPPQRKNALRPTDDTPILRDVQVQTNRVDLEEDTSSEHRGYKGNDIGIRVADKSRGTHSKNPPLKVRGSAHIFPLSPAKKDSIGFLCRDNRSIIKPLSCRGLLIHQAKFTKRKPRKRLSHMDALEALFELRQEYDRLNKIHRRMRRKFKAHVQASRSDRPEAESDDSGRGTRAICNLIVSCIVDGNMTDRLPFLLQRIATVSKSMTEKSSEADRAGGTRIACVNIARTASMLSSIRLGTGSDKMTQDSVSREILSEINLLKHENIVCNIPPVLTTGTIVSADGVRNCRKVGSLDTITVPEKSDLPNAGEKTFTRQNLRDEGTSFCARMQLTPFEIIPSAPELSAPFFEDCELSCESLEVIRSVLEAVDLAMRLVAVRALRRVNEAKRLKHVQLRWILQLRADVLAQQYNNDDEAGDDSNDKINDKDDCNQTRNDTANNNGGRSESIVACEPFELYQCYTTENKIIESSSVIKRAQSSLARCLDDSEHPPADQGGSKELPSYGIADAGGRSPAGYGEEDPPIRIRDHFGVAPSGKSRSDDGHIYVSGADEAEGASGKTVRGLTILRSLAMPQLETTVTPFRASKANQSQPVNEKTENTIHIANVEHNNSEKVERFEVRISQTAVEHNVPGSLMTSSEMPAQLDFITGGGNDYGDSTEELSGVGGVDQGDCSSPAVMNRAGEFQTSEQTQDRLSESSQDNNTSCEGRSKPSSELNNMRDEESPCNRDETKEVSSDLVNVSSEMLFIPKWEAEAATRNSFGKVTPILEEDPPELNGKPDIRDMTVSMVVPSPPSFRPTYSSKDNKPSMFLLSSMSSSLTSSGFPRIIDANITSACLGDVNNYAPCNSLIGSIREPLNFDTQAEGYAQSGMGHKRKVSAVFKHSIGGQIRQSMLSSMTSDEIGSKSLTTSGSRKLEDSKIQSVNSQNICIRNVNVQNELIRRQVRSSSTGDVPAQAKNLFAGSLSHLSSMYSSGTSKNYESLTEGQIGEGHQIGPGELDSSTFDPRTSLRITSEMSETPQAMPVNNLSLSSMSESLGVGTKSEGTSPLTESGVEDNSDFVKTWITMQAKHIAGAQLAAQIDLMTRHLQMKDHKNV